MKAFEVIEKPENWTQGENARDKDGSQVDPKRPEALCFCVIGAIIRAYGNQGHEEAPYELLKNALKKTSVSVWNDAPERTHAEVYNLLKSLDI